MIPPLDIDLLSVSRIDAGLTANGQRLSLLTFDGLGMFAIRDLGEGLTPVIAARVDLSIAAGIPGIFTAAGSAQVLLNTSGSTFTYVVPDLIEKKIREIKAAA